ncbi:hypothetical protein O6H91_02G079800 [Diphasiastrum complanatum]|uniref:Uncharacterized protein n=1 Tax=Diphasiastrum complanatum TaxID=34168 RepID=A0ACC2EHP0_DIPCM|nr:hypothetical protein O6H91_02G079800 [Diphasiastrum complanatum]
MSLKSILREIQDLRDGFGSMSRRSFEIKVSHHHRTRSHGVVLDGNSRRLDVLLQSKWASIPSELLRDIIQRLESSESSWPSRKHVVACSAVCCCWREVTKELVKTLEQSGKLTFPISLKQPGPRDTTLQCFIKRDQTTCTYCLYLGLSPNLVENGKFLLAARKFRRATSTDYIISLDPKDFSRGSNTYVGKLRSNFLGTKFTIYDSQPPQVGAVASTSRAGRRVGSKRVSPRVPAGSFNIAHIGYELNVLGTRGPRRMQCTLYSIPASAVEVGGCAPTPTEFSTSISEPLPFSSLLRSKTAVADCSTACDESITCEITKDAPLILKNKAPRWHEQLQCWCLNFRGRVTVASVKNFQLVAAADPSTLQVEHDKVLLQFGKIGKDMFTMDYRYPLSAFQSFSICLSSFDTKLACE